MREYRTITRQVGGVYLIQIIDFVLFFILFTFLTRFLSVSDFGVYSILNVSLLLITGLLGLGLSNYILQILPGKKETSKKEIFSKLFSSNLIFLSACLAILGITAFFLLNGLGYVKYFNPVVYILLTSGLMLSGYLITAYLKSKKNIVTATFLEFLIKSLWALPVILILFVKNDVETVFFIRLMVTLLVTLAIIIFLKYNGLKFINKIDWHLVKRAVFFGLPLITLVFSDWAITASDRYILAAYHGASVTGSYSFIYSLLNFILIFFSTSIVLTIYPYIVEAYNQRNESKKALLFNSLIKYSVALALPVLIGFLLLSKELITLISGSKYLDSIGMIKFLIFFPLLDVGNRILNKILLLEQKTKTLAKIYIYGMVLNIILNFIFQNTHYMGPLLQQVFPIFFCSLCFYRKLGRRLKLIFSI